jgi:CheY-like chemotaxis protein
MQNLVRSLGFIACTFASTEDFLQSPRLNDTACVIADVQMPGMSGIELQSHLLSTDRRTPIIFITAFHDDAIRARAMKAAAVCFLNKPVDGETWSNASTRLSTDAWFKPRYRSPNQKWHSRKPMWDGALVMNPATCCKAVERDLLACHNRANSDPLWRNPITSVSTQCPWRRIKPSLSERRGILGRRWHCRD